MEGPSLGCTVHEVQTRSITFPTVPSTTLYILENTTKLHREYANKLSKQMLCTTRERKREGEGSMKRTSDDL